MHKKQSYYLHLILMVSLAFFSISFILPQQQTKIYVVIFPPIMKAILTVNNLNLNVKGNHFAEFEVPGNEVDCALKIKLPVAARDPEALHLPAGRDIYLAIYLKQSKLLHGNYALDTVCRDCFFQLKTKCRKELKFKD